MEAEKLADLVPRLREVIKHRDEAIKGEQRQVRLYEVSGHGSPMRRGGTCLIGLLHLFVLHQAKNEALRANLDQVCYDSLVNHTRQSFTVPPRASFLSRDHAPRLACRWRPRWGACSRR